MIRALIVDDEAPARARLRRLLEAMPGVQVVGEAANGLEALEQVHALEPQLVFLDIEMPELGGLETARTLGPDGPAIIFATAYNEHALSAFEAAAVDYLVKPIAKQRLAMALKKVQKAQQTAAADLDALRAALLPARPPERLALRVGTRFVVFDAKEVSAVIARDHYAAVICGEKELLSDESLDTVIERLDGARFMRVHRGAIINLDFLRELERLGDRRYVAVLSDAQGSRVPISRERLPQLKSRLGMI